MELRAGYYIASPTTPAERGDGCLRLSMAWWFNALIQSLNASLHMAFQRQLSLFYRPMPKIVLYQYPRHAEVSSVIFKRYSLRRVSESADTSTICRHMELVLYHFLVDPMFHDSDLFPEIQPPHHSFLEQWIVRSSRTMLNQTATNDARQAVDELSSSRLDPHSTSFEVIRHPHNNNL